MIELMLEPCQSLVRAQIKLLLTSLNVMPVARRSLFRPCIDLHQGVVKQIVGASLQDDDRAKERAIASSSMSETTTLKTNFTSDLSPAHYANLYKSRNLRGAHVIKLGPGNDEAAGQAIDAWKDGLHVGGGINADNAKQWIERGAEKVSEGGLAHCVLKANIDRRKQIWQVIVTSHLFPSCKFSLDRLIELETLVGKQRLVVDVSCRRKGDQWVVAMNRWQDLTDMQVNKGEWTNSRSQISSRLTCNFFPQRASTCWRAIAGE